MNDSTGPQSVSQWGLPFAVADPRPERADARRNRLKVLEAADRLFTEHGVKNVHSTRSRLRRESEGTVFRRFGDRAGFAVALLDEREEELQAELLTGPPPFGPGTAPVLRVMAFLDPDPSTA